MTPTLLSELETMNDRYRTSRHTGDVTSALRLSMEFRFTHYAAADMPTLLSSIENLGLQISPSLNFLFPRPTQVDVGQHAYDEIRAMGTPRRLRDGAGRVDVPRSLSALRQCARAYLHRGYADADCRPHGSLVSGRGGRWFPEPTLRFVDRLGGIRRYRHPDSSGAPVGQDGVWSMKVSPRGRTSAWCDLPAAMSIFLTRKNHS